MTALHARNIRFKTATAERLREAAEDRDVSVNWLVNRIVEEALDRLAEFRIVEPL